MIWMVGKEGKQRVVYVKHFEFLFWWEAGQCLKYRYRIN